MRIYLHSRTPDEMKPFDPGEVRPDRDEYERLYVPLDHVIEAIAAIDPETDDYGIREDLVERLGI